MLLPQKNDQKSPPVGSYITSLKEEAKQKIFTTVLIVAGSFLGIGILTGFFVWNSQASALPPPSPPPRPPPRPPASPPRPPFAGVKVMSGDLHISEDEKSVQAWLGAEVTCVTDPETSTLRSEGRPGDASYPIATQCCTGNESDEINYDNKTASTVCRRQSTVGEDDTCIAGLYDHSIRNISTVLPHTYWEARDACAALGLRLCDGPCSDQGCAYDMLPVWTRVPCDLPPPSPPPLKPPFPPPFEPPFPPPFGPPTPPSQGQRSLFAAGQSAIASWPIWKGYCLDGLSPLYETAEQAKLISFTLGDNTSANYGKSFRWKYLDGRPLFLPLALHDKLRTGVGDDCPSNTTQLFYSPDPPFPPSPTQTE